MDAWNDSGGEVQLETGLPTWIGVDLSFSRDKCFMVIVQERDDDKLGVFLFEFPEPGEYLTDNPADLEKLADSIAFISKRYKARSVSYDPGTSGALAPLLTRRGLKVLSVGWGSQGFATACDQTLFAMGAGRLVHANQPALYEHLTACQRVPAGDGGFRIRRRSSQMPITAAISLVLALGAALAPQQIAKIYTGNTQ